MAEMQTVKMETWAVGRYLIDVPQGADVEYAQGYRGAGADVEVFPCLVSQAKKLVHDRIDELDGTIHLKGGTLLEKYLESKTIPYTWIIYRWDDRTYKGDVLDVDAYHLKRSTELHDSFSTNTYLFKFDSVSGPTDTEMIDRQHKLEDLFRRIRIRDNRVIPTEPGFCMAYSFMPGEPLDGKHSEAASITFAVPGHPDIFVRYENQVVTPTTAAGQKLLDRTAERDKNPLFSALTIDKLRARERAVGPLHGQECLEMAKEKGLWDLQFLWEFRGEGNSWQKPAMSLEMTNSRTAGSTAPLSMTKEEAMALWDIMVDSLRIRPTKPSPVPTAPAQP